MKLMVQKGLENKKIVTRPEMSDKLEQTKSEDKRNSIMLLTQDMVMDFSMKRLLSWFLKI